MELVDGPTLADRIAGGAIPLDEALPIARQIAAALEAAHERGIVHRDLKPANIKVRPDGTVKLLDFGLAKAMETSGPAAAGEPGTVDLPTITSPAMMTAAGVILGTAAYMSPEQARGKGADARSDIWAFGVVLAEMTTGRRTFEGETISDTIAAVLTREPDLDAVPPAVRRLVRLCLAKDPRARLRHIGDALAMVDDPQAIHAPARARGLWPWAAALAVTAISPDGRQVAFRIATATEAPALWLRPLDALEGRRIAGSDFADFPFWSPDGRSIAFFSAGKLERVDVNGGTPLVLCDASDGDSTVTGGSWNRDGVILIGAPQGLSRVSASGGVPALIAPVDARAGETGYGSPQFLPDGDRFVFFVRSEDRARAGYYVSSLSHPDRKTLLLSTTTKALLVANENGESSYLLYLQNRTRTLLARRLDRRTLALTGTPVPLASNVAIFPPGFHASFWSSSSGTLLAYRTEASDKPRLTWVYPDGKRQPDTGTDDFYTHVRVAPDGARAAMELADGTGNVDIWTWDFARRVKTRQTFGPQPDRAPTWAPNGRDIAFSALRSGVWQIFRKDVTSGRPEEPLTTGAGDKIVPDWSRDGRYLVFDQIGATTAEDIWAMPLEGDRRPFPLVQTPAVEANPALSPDGQWLAYETSQTGRPEVIVMRFPASPGEAIASAPRWQVSTQGGSRPRWSGDGRAVFYVSLDDRRIMRADLRTTAAGLESDPPRVFTEIPVMPVARSPFDVAADGRLVVLERTITQGAPLVLVADWRAVMARD
jgi:Tol biopolymer transport system component